MRIRSLTLLPLLALLAGCNTVGVTQAGGYAEVSPAVAHEMMLDTPQLVVLDIRPSDQYAAGHIAGALSAPLETIERRLPELVAFQPTTLLLYGDENDDSEAAARLLVAAGFRNVVRISGGIRQWMAGGYHTASSAQ